MSTELQHSTWAANSQLQAFACHQSRMEDSSFLFLFLNALRGSCQCTRTEHGLTEEPQRLSRGIIHANHTEQTQRDKFRVFVWHRFTSAVRGTSMTQLDYKVAIFETRTKWCWIFLYFHKQSKKGLYSTSLKELTLLFFLGRRAAKTSMHTDQNPSKRSYNSVQRRLSYIGFQVVVCDGHGKEIRGRQAELRSQQRDQAWIREMFWLATEWRLRLWNTNNVWMNEVMEADKVPGIS